MTQSYDKIPYTYRTFQKAKWLHKYAMRKLNYTTIADQLRMVSWSNDNHPTSVVQPVCGILPSHKPQKLCNQP